VIAEETRARAEVHEGRAFADLFADHAMLDALGEVREHEREQAEKRKER